MIHSKVKKCSDTAMSVLAKAVAKQFLASYSVSCAFCKVKDNSAFVISTSMNGKAVWNMP